MINEQTTPEDALSNEQEAKGSESETDKSADDYYDVDLPKKDSDTSIGDGEMRNEGLMGLGEDSETGLFSEGSTKEQDEAENHDSEG